jgi:FtsH-binding integral membrane protein
MHIATILSTLVVFAFGLRLVFAYFVGKRAGLPPLSGNEALVSSFFSAVLLVNALAHFTHGISGESFSGPYRFVVGPGLANNLLNVVWGFVNILIGYGLFARSQPLSTPAKRTVFFAGVLVMGIFLCTVFTHATVSRLG